MKLIGKYSITDPEECGGDAAASQRGVVVVVGVRLDSYSRELLTWALVKVARSGDRVIAIHVLNPDTSTEGKSTLLSLVNTFDSVLAAYEGLCTLKQVDLKLKVCRGSSVRKILVQEAKSFGAAHLIVGSSKARHTLQSSLLVAKYCARHLPNNFSVLAVENGKILFQREASGSVGCDLRDNDQSKLYVPLAHQSLKKRPKVLNNATTDVAASKSNEGQQRNSQNFDSSVEKSNCCNEENLLALSPAKNQIRPESKHGWALLRPLFFFNQRRSDKSSSRKKSVTQWAVKLPSRQSLSYVYPDHTRSNSDENDCHSLNLDGENGAIISSFQNDIALVPSSPSYTLKSLSKELKGLTEKYSSVCRLFSYEELLLATSNFKPENMVGKGGSSLVYRGFLPDGEEMAVKVLKPSEDMFRHFVLEIEIIMTLQHKNIISLLGFCFEDNNLLLVYDFLSRGSLEDNIHGTWKNEQAFSWDDRYKVALGIAKALDYLHNGAAAPIIHRDVKSSNILLSDDLEPQLSDFGLGIMLALDSSQDMTCTDIAGTFGYLAPEYFMHGKVNDRIDVYAFGIVLLELLSGRKPIDNGNPKGEESLVIWAKSIVKGGKFSQLLDPNLGGNFDHDQSERMFLAAALCIRRAPLFRPQISLVLKLLQGDTEVIKWARQRIGTSEDAGDEEFPTNMQSHLNLALLDLEDSLSIGSNDQSVSIKDYLQGRWSSSSSIE